MSTRKRLVVSVVFGLCVGSVWFTGFGHAASDEVERLMAYRTFLRGASYGMVMAQCLLAGEVRTLTEAQMSQALRLAFTAPATMFSCTDIRAIISQVTQPERTP